MDVDDEIVDEFENISIKVRMMIKRKKLNLNLISLTRVKAIQQKLKA
jgi:hypothetical protein